MLVHVTALYVARKFTVYKGKAMTVEVIDVKQPESYAGLYEVPNCRAQMMHFHGQLIQCKMHFQNGQPIRLTKVRLASELIQRGKE